MNKKKQTLFVGIIFLLGLLVFLYPVIGDIANRIKNAYEIAHYQYEIKEVTPNEYDAMFETAREINKSLKGVATDFTEDEAFYADYKKALSLSNGMMGSLVIDKIDVHLAIYHGTTESVLQDGIGYLEGTHLPTGDVGNSTVLTGHTGLPSATLLTNLDQLEIGDTFKVCVLDRTFLYEVFEIQVVLPHEVDTVAPREGIDMVTLVTCTPYGVNTHRLLVHGKQIEEPEAETAGQPDGVQTERGLIDIIQMMIIPIVVILLVAIILRYLVLPRVRRAKYSADAAEGQTAKRHKPRH